MRSIDGVGHTYYHTIKRPHGNSRIETERIISPREYSGLLSSAISVVKKDRLCFLYENQYFELDQFSVASLSFPGNQAVLEIELTRE